MGIGWRAQYSKLSDIVFAGASALFSIYLILYVIIFLKVLHFPIYPTVNRVTFFGGVVDWSITGSLMQDMFILTAVYSVAVLLSFKYKISIPVSAVMITISVSALAMVGPTAEYLTIIEWFSLPILIVLLIIDKKGSPRSKLLRNNLSADNGFLTIFLFIVIGLQIIVFARWLFYPFIASLTIQDWSWRLSLLDINYFYVIGLLSPYLFLLSTVSFLFKSLSQRFFASLASFFARIATFQSQTISEYNENIVEIISAPTKLLHTEIKTIPLIILIMMVLSAGLSIYPYLIDVKSDIRVLGSDIPVYVEWMIILSHSQDNYSFFQALFSDIDGGGRPLSLLLMYGLSSMVGLSFETILKYLPIMLSPLTVLVVYFFTSTAYPNDKKIAIIASFMTAVSYQIIVGFYAAFYSNWMALIVIYIASLFLLQSIARPNYRNFGLFGISNIIALLLHSYTWSYFVVVVVLYLIWSAVLLKRRRQSLKTIMIMAIIMSIMIGVDTVKSYASNSSTGFEKDLSLSSSLLGLDQFAQRWINLNAAFRLHVGGFLTNAILLGLLLIWTLKANYSNNSDRFLMSTLFVALVPILFGDYTLQARMIYNIPLHIPASIIMYKIYSSPSLVFRKPLFVVLLLVQLNYALRSMANMPLVIPN